MAETTAKAVADYIIHFSQDHGDLVTNLKLQKLVYYAQAWYLALYDKPLFDEELQAWISGPVQPELYDRFKSYKWNPISEHPEKVELPEQIKDHLIEIIEVFGKYQAYYLERMVKGEDPWLKARRGIPRDEHATVAIEKQDMQTYYKTLLEDDDEEEQEGQNSEYAKVG